MSVVLEKISKSYNSLPALANLDLEVKKGEFHVLLGPSGSGKTTVISIIAGLTKQDKGAVIIGDCNVNDLPPEKRSVGFVFQDYAQFPHLSVFENVAYGLRVRKVKEKEIIQKVDCYLSKVGIEKERNKFPHQLSGGQKQRVALARALITEPEILLMDEPMSNLDVLTKEKIESELKKIQKETGVTTVYVTHNQDEAFALGDRVSVLNNGMIEQIESPDELFYHPKTEFVANFVGAKNILNVRVIESDQNTVVAQVNNKNLNNPLKIMLKKYPIFKTVNEINLCIHPENIFIKKENNCVKKSINKIKGKIIYTENNTSVTKATIDIGGINLYAAIPKKLFNFKLYETVFVCFNMDAPHPLCGKGCRDIEAHRKCVNKNNKME